MCADYLETRDDFVGLIDDLGCKTAVEIGVGAGCYSRVLLRSKIEKLWMVDCWTEQPNRELYRGMAYDVARQDPGRVEIAEQDCIRWMATIPDSSIDFVYLDTDHRWPHVTNQLPECWRIARVVLAGHDYQVWQNIANHDVDVVPAVEELSRAVGRCVHVTGCRSTEYIDRLRAAYAASALPDHGPWGCLVPSWWIVK